MLCVALGCAHTATGEGGRGVSLDIWSRGDIRNVLMAVSAASQDAGGNEDYRRGHAAALAAVAMAFGCGGDLRLHQAPPARCGRLHDLLAERNNLRQ